MLNVLFGSPGLGLGGAVGKGLQKRFFVSCNLTTSGDLMDITCIRYSRIENGGS